MTTRQNYTLLAAVLVIFAMATRVLFNELSIFNFNAIMASGLFAGAYLSRKRLAILVPLAAMFATDLFIGFYDWHLMAVVYGAILLSVVLGSWYAKRPSVLRLAGSAITGSFAFFLLTNVAVWLFADGSFYPHTLAGLTESLTMGIPFYKMSFVGDMAWTVLLFGSFEWVRSRATRRALAAAM